MPEPKPVVKLPPVEQVGIVVKDMDKAIQYYTDVFGIGPFRVVERRQDFAYKGKTVNCRLKLAFAMSGPLEIELIQVLEGETPHTDFIREHGEGLHHLRFRVENLDGMLASLAKVGIHSIFNWAIPNSTGGFAYVNSDKVGGVMFELIERKDPPKEGK